MIISEKYKFIFIHVPKTGGISLRNTLNKYGQSPEVFANNHGRLFFEKRKHRNLVSVPPHLNLISAQKIFNLPWNEYTIFSVIRNPWDRVISFYKYWKYIKTSYREHHKVKQMNIDEFIPFFIKDAGHDTQPQAHYFLAEGLQANYLRFESLEEDLFKLSERLFLPKLRVKKMNSTDGYPEENLSEKSIELISKYEQEVIKIGQYETYPSDSLEDNYPKICFPEKFNSYF